MGIFSSLLKAVPGASLVDAGVSLFSFGFCFFMEYVFIPG